MDYPDFAEKLGRAILDGQAERGVLVCGSGVGACIAANKMDGIYAGLCHDVYSARQGVEHDDMNVLCLGARIIGPALVPELVKAFLGAKFSTEERHRRRVGKIRSLELKGTHARFLWRVISWPDKARKSPSTFHLEGCMSSIEKIHQSGQSLWYDNIQRRLLRKR